MLKEVKKEIGTILVLLGIPIASVLNEYTKGKYEITNTILLISLLLIIDLRNLFHLRFYINKNNLLIFLFQFYVIIIQFISGQKLFEQARGMIYTIFTIAIIISISTANRLENPKHFIKLLWWTIGIFNFLVTNLMTHGFTNFYIIGTTRLEYGADRLTLSNLGFTFILVSLIYKPNKGKINIFFSILFWLSTIFSLLYCNRRASLLYCIIIIILHYFYYEKEKLITHISLNKLYKVFAKVFFLVITCILLFIFIPNLFERIGRYTESIKSAINTVLGMDQTDEAGAIRYSLRMNALKILSSDTNLRQWIFGRGYMFQYLDFPFLQAIVDMGIIFGSLYIIIHTFLPLKSWTHVTDNVAVRFLQYYSILFFFNNFFGGIPYGYGKFVPLIILFKQEIVNRVKGDNIEDDSMDNRL